MSDKSKEHRKIYEYIIELGIRLKSKSLTIGYAVVYCYKVIQKNFPDKICLYTMATSCLLLAGKVTNDTTIVTKDVVNMCYRILHPSEPPLEIGELSYALRQGLVEMELVTLRFLRFRFNFEHPHQDLVLMISILRDWFPQQFQNHPNIDEIAAMFLQDLYVQPQIIVDHKPKTIAVLVISMAFGALKLDISDESWVPTLHTTLDIERLQKLKRKALEEIYSPS
ncbi:cyclin-related protein FAM58A [Ditylenchus destructor]|nr:cyclin-related protein FAM58A [Ditylenchus destructor]